MASDLKKILINDLIDLREGGFVDNKDDSGGATKYGITEAVARENGYTGLMKDLPREKAFEIYEKKYWKALNLDLIIIAAGWKIAEKLFDIAVNCGSFRAGEFLQRTLNVFNMKQAFYKDLKVDGGIGEKTVLALRDYMNHREKLRGEEVILKTLNGLQLNHYITLAERREKDEAFVYGWVLKRIN